VLKNGLCTFCIEILSFGDFDFLGELLEDLLGEEFRTISGFE